MMHIDIILFQQFQHIRLQCRREESINLFIFLNVSIRMDSCRDRSSRSSRGATIIYIVIITFIYPLDLFDLHFVVPLGIEEGVDGWLKLYLGEALVLHMSGL